MFYLHSIYKNTRYIVFIQTKYHQNILPVNDVSPRSLDVLLKTIWDYRGGMFRSIRIHAQDITTLKVYEMNFYNYKDNVLKNSEFWRKIFNKYQKISGILNFILYQFVYKSEVELFWNQITNKKPKYLIDKTADFLDIVFSKRREYKKTKDGKEIIEIIDFFDNKLYINEEQFSLDDSTKSWYFLKLLIIYFSKNENIWYISLSDFVDFYEKQSRKDGQDYNYLILNNDNIKNSYIQTINSNILKKYNKEILEMEDYYIKVVTD